MKWESLLTLVGAEPVFSSALLLAGNVSLPQLRLQLSRWVKAGRLLQLRRGVYALAPTWRKVEPHPFVVANALQRGSYVSLQSALAHHGVVPEHVPVVTSVGPGRPEIVRNPLGTFQFQHVSKNLLFGYARVELARGQLAFVARPEKALLDLVHLSPHADSPTYLRELRLQDVQMIDPELLWELAERSAKPKLRRAARATVDLLREEEESAVKEHLRELVETANNNLARLSLAREYLQARILESLQHTGAFTRWAFLGGTALRFLFSIPRFSEDLDFSLASPKEDTGFRDACSHVKRSLEREGYPLEIKVNDRKTVAAAFMRFPGLPYELGISARRSQKLSIKVELDSNPPQGAGVTTTIVRRHVVLHLCHYDKPSLLAGKLHAVLNRPWVKGRDLYDLVWYLSDRTWPAPNLELLNAALAQTAWKGPVMTPLNWRGTVRNHVARLDWEQARNDVRPFLEREHDLALVTLETLQHLLGDR